MVLKDNYQKHKLPFLKGLWPFFRAVFQMFSIVVHVLIGGSILLLETMTVRYRPFENWMLKFWGKMQLVLCGVDVVVSGEENIPNEGCLFLFNHMSYADIYATFGYIPRPFRFGAKIELFSIPVFGPAMRSVGILPIVRNDRQAVYKVYQDAIARVKNGECFALAPEGTRQIEPVLGKFKLGPFIFAINAQMPIVPVILAGTHEVQPKGSWLINRSAYHRTVILDICPPIATREMSLDQAKELSDKVFAIMQTAHARAFAKYNQQLNASIGG